METKRILTEEHAKDFFNTSINTLEDAIGEIKLDCNHNSIEFNFNAVLLLSFPDIYADHPYRLDHPNLDRTFVNKIRKHINKTERDVHFEYHKIINQEDHRFLVKMEQMTTTMKLFTIISVPKLFDTEQQLSLFSTVVGSGLSLFAGSTWWIDYDLYSDHFFCSDVGPEILGIPLSKNKLYNTPQFQTVREKARIVSELYDESVTNETEAYERVRNNETDYFAGRTPTVTADDEIVWVEAYGKCILRYPDGSPRFFLAIDIYMSEIHEEKTQLELLNNLIDYGLINADVGIWYHQRHYKEGKYYFTESYQKLMDDDTLYRNDTFTSLLNNQIARVETLGMGYEEYLHNFRTIHNSIYTKGLDKYHITIPNLTKHNALKWIEVRGTVIERDEEGHVMLFVGVNVDVTESTERERELERLKVQNERLQMAENLAIKARNLMVWYQDVSEQNSDFSVFGNQEFSTKLGVSRSRQGLISYRDLRRTIDLKGNEKKLGIRLINAFRNVYSGNIKNFERLLAKHRNLETGETIYIEHSVEVAEYSNDGLPMIIGGVLLDVTTDILRERQIRYLADYDQLTDVYNRNYFERFTREHLPKDYSIILFDIDGLKLINDVYGHMVGDDVIKQLASLLKECFTNCLFISRIGGDEFAILYGTESSEYILERVDALDRKIETFNATSPIELVVSKGAKQVHNQEISFEEAFVEAENLMYRRKLNNRKSRKSKVLESIIETLNAKTEETKEHSERMAIFAVRTMKELGMSRGSEIEDMELLARVHDVGKITIHDSILKNPNKLTPSEFEIIKKHSEAGYKIIRNITDSDNVCNGVLLHHERWDGTGYPQGLKGEEIPIFARIISVVDAYDAMTNDRIYNKAKSHGEALEELISCKGTQFDPAIVDAFIAGNFPNKK